MAQCLYDDHGVPAVYYMITHTGMGMAYVSLHLHLGEYALS